MGKVYKYVIAYIFFEKVVYRRGLCKGDLLEEVIVLWSL